MARKCSVERAEGIIGGFATAKKNITIQYGGRERSEENLLQMIKRDAIQNGVNDSDINEIDIYIKPEEGFVYYVINKETNGKIAF
ncbi:MAG: DUF6465 family protein [Lachnospiraceae bacterium]|nr:DUF6465 family protein [Lachnospiraceae bacterium]